MGRFCIPLKIALATLLVALNADAHSTEIKLPLTKTAAFSISSDAGDFAYTPLQLVPRALNVKVELNTFTPQISTGPASARNLADDATITSSFARYDYPAIATPHTSSLLSNFSGLTGVNMFEGVDVSIAYFDNDHSEDGSVESIKLFRQWTWTAVEDEGTRHFAYVQLLDIASVGRLLDPAQVSTANADAISAILDNRETQFTRLSEEFTSFLQGCPSGCISEATGARYIWEEVPRGVSEPASMAIFVVLLAICFKARAAPSLTRNLLMSRGKSLAGRHRGASIVEFGQGMTTLIGESR